MEQLIIDPAARLAMCGAAVFFMTGLITGVWKYYGIRTSPKAEAPYYTNIAHRAALLYSFSAILLAIFASLSALPYWLNLSSVAVLLFFFSSAILRYIQLGIKNETENQHLNPGNPTGELVFLSLLILGEVGGFLVLMIGFVMRLLQN